MSMLGRPGAAGSGSRHAAAMRLPHRASPTKSRAARVRGPQGPRGGQGDDNNNQGVRNSVWFVTRCATTRGGWAYIGRCTSTQVQGIMKMGSAC